MGTITKALELLNLFSRTKPEIGLMEFARLSGRDKATVHRHLTELEENGFVEQHPQTRAYRLGPAILRLTAVREVALTTLLVTMRRPTRCAASCAPSSTRWRMTWASFAIARFCRATCSPRFITPIR